MTGRSQALPSWVALPLSLGIGAAVLALVLLAAPVKGPLSYWALLPRLVVPAFAAAVYAGASARPAVGALALASCHGAFALTQLPLLLSRPIGRADLFWAAEHAGLLLCAAGWGLLCGMIGKGFSELDLFEESAIRRAGWALGSVGIALSTWVALVASGPRLAGELGGVRVYLDSYAKDETDASGVAWLAPYPEPSIADDPARRRYPNARWKTGHHWKGDSLCLEVRRLETPYPPEHVLAIGYRVRLEGASFMDGTGEKTLLIERFAGTPPRADITRCFPIRGAPAAAR